MLIPNEIRNKKTSKIVAEYWSKSLTNDKKWWNISDPVDGVTRISIFDIIGFPFIDEVEFIQELNDIENDIELTISSPGGEVFAGLAIANAIQQHPSKITVINIGIIGSISTVISSAADVVLVHDNSFFMIHRAFTIQQGNTLDMIATSEVLQKIDNTIANVYKKRTGVDHEEILNMMTEETWFSAEEAISFGLADGRFEDDKNIVQAKINTINYKNIPEGLKVKNCEADNIPESRDLVKILQREANISRKEADRIIHHGYKDNASDQDDSARDAKIQIEEEQKQAAIKQLINELKG